MLGLNYFFKHNLSKLLFGILFSGIVFGTLTALIFLIAVFFDTEIELKFALEITKMVAILGALIVGFASILGVMIRTYFFKKVYSTSPFNKLENIGFKEKTIHKENRWRFTDKITFKKINDYEIVVDIDPKKYAVIKFFVKCQFKKRSKDELKEIQKKIKEYNINFDYNGMSKKYNVRKMTVISISQSDQELHEFVSLLKSLHIEPFQI